MNGLFLLPVLLIASSLPEQHSTAPAHTGITVSTTLDGMRLTLSVPRRSYPRNALIRVAVRMTNRSHLTMPLPYLSDTGRPCAPSTVEVFNDHYIVRYPPVVQARPGEPLPVSPPCGAPGIEPTQLRPGQTVSGSDLVILRAEDIHATVYARRIRVTTPTVRLVLTPSQPLPVTVSQGAGGVYATVRPRGTIRSRLYVNSVWECHEQGMVRVNAEGWGSQSSRRVHSGCSSPAIWYAAVGYLNRPVGVIDYVKPTRSPALS